MFLFVNILKLMIFFIIQLTKIKYYFLKNNLLNLLIDNVGYLVNYNIINPFPLFKIIFKFYLNIMKKNIDNLFSTVFSNIISL